MEVAPYYGTLEEVYKLLVRACRKTNQLWHKGNRHLARVVTKRKLKLGNKLTKEVLIACTNYPQLLEMFEFGLCEVLNKEMYESFYQLLELVRKPEMLTNKF